MEVKEGVKNALAKAYATANTDGIFYANPNSPMLAQAAKLGLVQFNTNLLGQTEGQFAARLTVDGARLFSSTESSEPAVNNGSTPEMTTSTPVAGNPTIAGYAAATVAPPSGSGRGGKSKWSPVFDGLSDGQSVFIPVTEDKPKPWDSIASTVTNMNRKALESANAGETPKYFKVFHIEDGAAYGEAFAKKEGAALFRLDAKRPAA